MSMASELILMTKSTICFVLPHTTISLKLITIQEIYNRDTAGLVSRAW